MPSSISGSLSGSSSIGGQMTAISGSLSNSSSIGGQMTVPIQKYPIIIDDYWYVWDIASNQYVTTGVKATGDDGDDYVLTQDDKVEIAGLVQGMMTVIVEGTSPVITAQANYRYKCGEIVSLSFTPPSAGIVGVMFTSGTSLPVLTLPNTVVLPEWFELETERVYEICITDGVWGAVMSWPIST